MSVFVAPTGTLFDSDEMIALQPEVEAFMAEAAESPNAELRLDSRRVLVSEDVAESPVPTPERIEGWTPIGVGRPLTIRIEHIYVGQNRKTRDYLVTSAAKSSETQTATAKAMNCLARGVQGGESIAFPADQHGTRLVYYSPAATDDEMVFTVRLWRDDFPGDAVAQVAGLFQSAGDMPIFLPARTWLLAGASLVRTVGSLANRLIDNSPFLSGTEAVNFGLPGKKSVACGMVLGNSAEGLIVDGWKVGNKWALEKNGVGYSGPEPYFVVSLDGQTHAGYDAWTPTAVTSAVMGRFLDDDDLMTDVAEAVREGLQLYNDLNYAERANGQLTVIADLKAAIAKEDDPVAKEGLQNQLAREQARYDGYKMKIKTQEFKAKLP